MGHATVCRMLLTTHWGTQLSLFRRFQLKIVRPPEHWITGWKSFTCRETGRCKNQWWMVPTLFATCCPRGRPSTRSIQSTPPGEWEQSCGSGCRNLARSKASDAESRGASQTEQSLAAASRFDSSTLMFLLLLERDQLKFVDRDAVHQCQKQIIL